ncbi:IclR family transcriptional regulator [Frankia tisae]|uniref:IclR family transcriptional regulator n=1 Tax=Frankia tisae TaxID=2950104 RepID=UPI0021C21E8E|nr:IclR family transcriptional regulator [Frankia tisae]
MTLSEAQNRTGEVVQSVSRAVRLLRCFAESEVESMTLTELAHRTGLHLTTAHRLLRTLCAESVLAYSQASERYSLGPMTLRLGRSAAEFSGLDHVAPLLRRLVDDTGETAGFSTREGAMVRTMVTVESEQPLRFDGRSQTRTPMHISAAGKALLAFGPQPLAEAVAALGRLPASTDRTLTTFRALEADLAVSRARGYTVCDEEQFVGVRAYGAPLLDEHGIARAAIAVIGPTARLTDARVPDVVASVQAAAAALTRVLHLERLG